MSSDEEEEVIESLEQYYQRLVEVTQNELELTDDLLPYQAMVVEHFIEQVTHMNNGIIKHKAILQPFCVEQHKIVIERISYLINTYLRTRLRKIENNAPALIKLLRSDPERASRFLSRPEKKYLDRFNDSIDDYIKNIIKDMPENMHRFRLASVKPKDRLRYAFVVGLSDARIVDGEAEVMLEPDVCRILTVPSIVELIEKGARDFRLI